MNEIHVTDVQTFCTCRRKWDWSSMLRCGLQPVLPPEPLILGQGVHIALDKYYQLPYEQRHVISASWFFEAWLNERSMSIEDYKGRLWKSDVNLLSSTLTLGTGMLKHYHLWAHGRDAKYDVIDTEVHFELPLPTDPPTVLAGRFDGIFEDATTGKLYIMEFKTARSLTNIAWTLRNLQGAVYTHAAREIYRDEVVEGIIYRILRKKVPSDPKPLQRGGFSQAVNQDTSYEWFVHCLENEVCKANIPQGAMIIKEDLLDRLKLSDAANSKILNHLLTNDHKFFLERVIRKRPAQIENAKRALITLAHDMVSDPPIVAMPGIHCSWCSFKEPCDLMEYGMERDAEALLSVEYARRDYWEGKDE